MDIKKLEGSVSVNDFIEGLVSHGNCKTLGEVWEKCVTCNHCEHKEACRALIDEHFEIKCREVIDILLGNKKIEDIYPEVD